ncbi:thiamine pyrophosphate-binding protein [Paenibacillus athensensis]|nr:thiamine pyrophosphate-binding protein [Paenibacillus athensensis]MCD1258117.1 thiamine pyrophosphate-binding protein [Paenibacillus athensensis]
MRAIEAALRGLSAQGIRYVFGIPAGSINALYDALLDMPELQPIVVKHETSAGYMASAYTRITGIPSICVGSSGPGATNLVTPAAHAWREKLPVLFITGAVPTSKLGKGGAQELDAEPIFAPVTKLSTTVLDAKLLPQTIAEALHTAQSGIPGPVHVAIPIDIQMTDIGEGAAAAFPYQPPLQLQAPDPALVVEAGRLVLTAGERGALLLGHGAKSAAAAVRRLAETTGWPVATTPRGKGAFPEDHPLSLGVYGLAGNAQAVEHLNGPMPEVLLAIGTSLGELATGNWAPELVRGKRLIHIDYDVAEFDKMYKAALNLCGDARQSVEALLDVIKPVENSDWPLVADQSAAALEEEASLWNTQAAICKIGAFAPDNARFYLDIGEFMTYSLQNLRVRDTQDFDIDINFGAMGSGIGGALGAQLAEPDRPVICITGDGCFFMHGMEVLTAKEYGLPVLFFVINNARLGMVYHGHMLQYKRCLNDFSQNRTDIAALAATLGLRYAQAASHEQFQAEHMADWLEHREPMVVEIVVDGNEVPPMGERVKFLQGATY